MNKAFKISLFLCLILLSTILLPACGRQNEISSNSEKQATIRNVNYSSLTEAVENAKSGDTIKIYTDLKDNKNVVISKPLTIKGVLNNRQIRPKFYGSITIDMNGENDSTSIENLEIVHQGTIKDGLNNDTRIGINLINGGLSFKSNIVSLDDENQADNGASGIIISRKINSTNTQPILIKGNSFTSYKSDNNNTSAALIIKSNLPNVFQKITLNENDLLNQNSFETSKEGNLLLSVNYAQEPAIFPFFATTSITEILKALNNHQPTSNSTFILYPTQPLAEQQTEPYIINETTSLYIEGNTPADFNNTIFKLAGSMIVNSGLNNTIIEKTQGLSNIIFGENATQSNVKIIK